MDNLTTADELPGERGNYMQETQGGIEVAAAAE